MSVNIELFTGANGKTPVALFLNELEHIDRARITKRLNFISDNFEKMDSTNVAPLRNGILELRIHVKSGNVRLLGFREGPDLILTNGFLKKTNQAPNHFIDLAEKYRSEYYHIKDLENNNEAPRLH